MARRRYQRGSLFQRGKRQKVWVARWWEDFIRPDGTMGRKRRAEVIGTVAELPTRRKAMQILSERLRLINSGNHKPQSTRMFGDFVREDWIPVVLPTLKYATQKHYQYLLDVHLLPALGDRRLSDISREVVQNLVSAKLRSGLSWKTVKHIRAALGRVLGFAEEWGYIAENPTPKTKLPRRAYKPQRFVLTPDEIRLLISSLREPVRSVVQLLVLTGLRVGELLALRWPNVDLEAGWLRVAETVYEGHFDMPKTRSSARLIPVGSLTLAVLAARHREANDENGLVFSARAGQPLNRRNLLRRHLQPACAKLGLPRVDWHSLRHSNATLHDAAGTSLGTIQALLGHASPEVTRQVYVHSVPEDQRRAVERVEKLFFGPKWTQIVEACEDAASTSD